MQECARIVEKLDITSPDKQNIADSTYFQLAQLQGSNTLFCSLKTLHIKNEPQYNKPPFALSHLPLFLSPTLTSITISHLEHDAAGSLARFLAVNCCGPLRSLTLHSFELSPLLATSISQCQSLETLDLIVKGQLNYSLIQSALSGPRLSNIKLNTKETNYIGLKSTPAADTAGDRVGDIEHILLGGQIGMVKDVITTTTERNISGFTINLDIYDGKVVQDLFQHLSARQASIMHLSVSNPLKQSHPSYEQYATTIDASSFCDIISPSTFHELRRLEIHGLALQQLDKYLPRMVIHWQHIEHLSFARTDKTGSITLATLKLVAGACPNLVFFEASFNPPGKDFFESSSDMSDWLLSHKLVRLSLLDYQSERSVLSLYSAGTIEVEVAQSVARYLYALFPELQHVGAHSWRSVAEFYQLIQRFCRREVRELNNIRQRQQDGAGG